MTDEFSGPPKTWPPLGLPTGSVRALLTILITSVVVAKLILAQQPEGLWVEALMIALAHYFTSRRFVDLSPAAMSRLQEEGLLDKEQYPLYLPKHTIRLLLISAFVGAGIYLYGQNRLLESQAVGILGMVFAYLLGTTVRAIVQWWNRRREKPSTGTWGDIQAMIVIVAMLVAAVPEFLNVGDAFPPIFHRVALGMALFYFGAR